MTKIINFDDLKTPAAVAIIIDGKRHEMKPPTVQDFIDNLELIDQMGKNEKVSMADEIKASIAIIARSFPTLTEQQVLDWPLENILKVRDLIQSQGDEQVEKDAPGNVAAPS